MIKKFHWPLHLGPAFQRFQKSTCLFCNGAQASLYLQICIDYLQYCCVSTHTLPQECLAEELFHLKQPSGFADGISLIDAHPPRKQFHSLMEQSFGHVIPTDSLLAASGCQLQKAVWTKQDIVPATPFQAMEALAFVFYKGNVFASAQLLELEEDAEKNGACFWTQLEKQCLMPAHDMLMPLIYNKDKNKVKTLIPWQVRHLLKK